MSSKIWGGRFDLPADKFAEEFGAVIHIETRMCQDDIQGSIAHAKMLAHQGIISQEDGEKIVQGLGAVLEEIKSGQLTEFCISVVLCEKARNGFADCRKFW